MFNTDELKTFALVNSGCLVWYIFINNKPYFIRLYKYLILSFIFILAILVKCFKISKLFIGYPIVQSVEIWRRRRRRVALVKMTSLNQESIRDSAIK